MRRGNLKRSSRKGQAFRYDSTEKKAQDEKRGEKAVLRITSEGFCRRVVVLCDMYKCNKLKILGVLY